MHRVSCWQRVFEDSPRGTLALFCSDGRYSRYVDEFLESLLRVDGADWLAVPGGAASLAGTARCEDDTESLWRQLAFLVEANEVQRVILVFHESCRYCASVLGPDVTPAEAKRRACDDAVEASLQIRRRFPHVSVEAYWHEASDTAALFRSIPDECEDEE